MEIVLISVVLVVVFAVVMDIIVLMFAPLFGKRKEW